MKKEITIWIVVPVFNRAEKVYNFINQILSQTFQSFKLIIVDHGTVDIYYSVFDDSRIVVLKENPELWWTGATNRGVEYVIKQSISASDFVLIINDDVHIGKNYLQSIVEVGANYPNSIVSSVCVDNETNEIINAGYSLNRLRAKFISNYEGYKLNELPTSLIQPDTFTGRGTLIPIKIFKDMGLFLEKKLPHCGADNEFVYRAKESGYHLLISKNCIVKTTMNIPLRGKHSKFSFIKNQLFGTKSKGNIPTLFALSFLYFKMPYGIYYFILNATRKTLSTLNMAFKIYYLSKR